MRRILGLTAKTIAGVSVAVALFVFGVMASVVMLGWHDAHAEDTVIEHHSYTEQRVTQPAPRIAMDDDDDAIIEKRTRVEEKRVEVPAPRAHVVEEHTVETVPAAPAIVEKRTTVREVAPPAAVIEKRTETV